MLNYISTFLSLSTTIFLVVNYKYILTTVLITRIDNIVVYEFTGSEHCLIEETYSNSIFAFFHEYMFRINPFGIKLITYPSWVDECSSDALFGDVFTGCLLCIQFLYIFLVLFCSISKIKRN